MASPEVRITEEVKINALCVTDQIGQAVAHDAIQPTARAVRPDPAAYYRMDSQGIRTQDIAAGALKLTETDDIAVGYLWLRVSSPVVLAFTQDSVAKTFHVSSEILIDLSSDTLVHSTEWALSLVTVLATVDGTNVRWYWAGNETYV